MIRPDGKHGHSGAGPLDHGRKKRWGQDRPVNHDSDLLADDLVVRRRVID